VSCNPKDFAANFLIAKVQFWRALLEAIILDLLADREPTQARDFVLTWGERRNASWADAARQALQRAASVNHLPQIRGQLRYHLGEIALAEAAGAAKAGYLPVKTTPPGGVFVVARIGRFALVNVAVRNSHALPRRSVTRKLLSQRNVDLNPHGNLFEPTPNSRGTTELAYFGCVVSVPWRRDPTVPAELAIAIPNAALSEWLIWMPLNFAFARLQERVDSGNPQKPSGSDIPDKVFPKFRFPKRDDTEDDKKGA
jgi:hypothetical protein